ncbi:MAG: hypothetical protein RIF32_22635 [Leptospirales bacterium]|jgi:hypothetical protein
MKRKTLIVPCSIEALFVGEHSTTVMNQDADFARLPYVEEGSRLDRNSDQPYLFRSIESAGMNHLNLRLEPGMHLHWQLPEAFFHGHHDAGPGQAFAGEFDAGDSDTVFPEVPNRYLVTRSRKSAAGAFEVSRQWVVESDYITTDGTADGGRRSVYYAPPASGTGLPFRYIGRRMPIDAWRQDFSETPGVGATEYLESLTVLGYGNSKFARFYPNCHTVFGFVDRDIQDAAELDQLQYDLVGWYSDPRRDIFATPDFARQDLAGDESGLLYVEAEDVQDWPGVARAVLALNEKHPGLLEPGFAESFAGQADRIERDHGLRGQLLNEINHILNDPETPQKIGRSDRPAPGDSVVRLNRRLLDEGVFAGTIDAPEKKWIRARYDWRFDGAALPERCLLYGELRFRPGSFWGLESRDTARADVTVASTASEALSVRVARLLAEESEAGGPPVDREELETMFEALQLHHRFESDESDVLARFKDVRHQNEFRPVDGETHWSIRKTPDEGPLSGGDFPRSGLASEDQQEVEMHPDWAADLGRLNRIQAALDRARARLATKRRQLYADWQKYMIAAYPPFETRGHHYPDIDLIANFIRVGGLESVQSLRSDIGDESRQGSSNRNEQSQSLNQELRRTHAELESKIELFNREHDGRYELLPGAGPRYWEPNEPVLLLTGKDAKQKAAPRAHNGLECIVRELDSPGDAGSLRVLRDNIMQALSTRKPGVGAYGDRWCAVWSEQPWNPLYLEWQVQMLCRGHRNNQGVSGKYHADFITHNYHAPWGDPDLELKASRSAINARGGAVYAGRSALSGVFQEHFLIDIAEYFYDRGLLKTAVQDGGHWNAKWQEESARKRAYIEHPSDLIERLLGWLSRTGEQLHVYQRYLARALEILYHSEFSAQSLSGINEQMLGLRTGMELDLRDPLAFDVYRAFSESEVHPALGDGLKTSPIASNPFNPIRSGALKILRLRLVDRFGQVREVLPGRIGTAQKLTIRGSHDLVGLPPRFVEPVRLNFRWLAAESAAPVPGEGLRTEMNSHPSTQPICGWFVASRLEKSIFVFDSDGRGLGRLSNHGFHALPGEMWPPILSGDSDQAERETQLRQHVSNEYMRGLLGFLLGGKAIEVTKLGAWIINRLESIEPDADEGEHYLSLMMSRPVALVRASLGLEAPGEAAVNQTWDAFLADLHRGRRETDAYTHVGVPVRLGRKHKVNDGLIGYWLEHDGGYYENRFFHAENEPTLQDEEKAFHLSLAELPRICTMLIDVQGHVSAAVGVAPAKEIDLPVEKYRASLKNIELSFLAAPLLGDSGRVRVPLPEVPGYRWQWAQRRGVEWERWSARPMVDRADFIARLNEISEFQKIAVARNINAGSVWDYLLSERVGWLAPDSETEATIVVERAVRGQPDFVQPEFLRLETIIENLIEEIARGVLPPAIHSRSSRPSGLSEGYMNLKRNPAATPGEVRHE